MTYPLPPRKEAETFKALLHLSKREKKMQKTVLYKTLMESVKINN